MSVNSVRMLLRRHVVTRPIARRSSTADWSSPFDWSTQFVDDEQFEVLENGTVWDEAIDLYDADGTEDELGRQSTDRF